MSSGFITEHFAAHSKVVEQSAKQLSEQAETVACVLVDALKKGQGTCFWQWWQRSSGQSFSGELLGRFAMTRQPFPAIALSGEAGTVTCISNDFGYDSLFERQLQALAQPGDIAFGFTTSGRSENVRRGLAMAHKQGAITVAVTGAAGLVDGNAEHLLAVPSDVTAHIQEVHLILLHVWCIHIDKSLGIGQSAADER